ncbi:hypothetical protein L1F06_016085 [Ectopseudomonas hydrolytica]|uniref:Uncharacterized protein n=1 Tax=Ectopseudomonas hydrolytica TaxID=2493633 RepID=A0ABY5A387_9GAMM|nr:MULTISPECIES: hypothetical protein [Pseudomonas]MDH0097251.1 hypothetical protein [Pseudomonas sp. GD04158]USR38187.1 hypothetical protein L1F06_016085 [Pseudomonas hydrolytica]
MEIRDALNLIHRIENLPEIYNKIEMAVCSVIHSYFDEMLEVEKKESAVMGRENYSSDELNSFLDQKRSIYDKYWSNHSAYYQPCSSSSEPRHVWAHLCDIEVLQNGDDENPLFIFKANYKKPDSSTKIAKAFILKESGSSLKIEHEFFG